MPHSKLVVVLAKLAIVLALFGCGGGDGGGDTSLSSSDIGTLAYVVTECRDTPGFSEHQTLHILHGDRDVTVMQTPEVTGTGIGGLCRFLTLSGFGDGTIARDAFQGVAVSADGAAVVFETTDEFSVFPPLPLHLPPQQKGIFVVRADGTGLRSLGPPSRLPFFFLRNGAYISNAPGIAFSPDSRLIAFADTGPDAAGNDAGQVVTLEIGNAQRRQVTHLPPGLPPAGLPLNVQGVLYPAFIDNQTIGFFTDANPDGVAEGHFNPFIVRSDGSGLKPAPVPVTLPDSQIVPTFVITGDKPAAVSLRVAGQAENSIPNANTAIYEVFTVDGPNLLQLTNLQRVDTANAFFDIDRQNVFFLASGDPFGTNPSETCQIFSVDRNGGNLRQLTQFSKGPHSANGCTFSSRPGCAEQDLSQDSKTGTLVFQSNCDPLGTNPHGAQVYAMRPDGSGLRQLTHLRGAAGVIGELPGPIAYGPFQEIPR